MWKISHAVGKKLGKWLPSRRKNNRDSVDDDDDDDDSVSWPSIHQVASLNENNNNMNTNDDSEHSSHNLPMLYCLARRWASQAVTFRTTTHPHEADSSHKDHKGDTCLHWTCFGNPPLECVEALLQACPQLASTPNHDDILPIHSACMYRASPDVIRALLRVYPEGASQTIPNVQQTPLHLLSLHGGSVDSFRAVLETGRFAVATLSQPDLAFCRTPLSLLSARKNMHQFHRMVNKLRNESRRHTALLQEGATLQQDDIQKLQDIKLQCASFPFWQKARLLVQTEYNDYRPSTNNDDETHQQIVHACVGNAQCPNTLLEYAILLHPEQLLEQDEQGRLPLHIAAQQSYHVSIDSLRDVIAASPRKAATIRDNHGCLAIEYAVRRRERKLEWNEGISQLLELSPISLESLDLDDRLYPYVWARLATMNRTVGAQGLLDAIRAKPHLFNVKR